MLLFDLWLNCGDQFWLDFCISQIGSSDQSQIGIQLASKMIVQANFLLYMHYLLHNS
jgi:hypothetical protein